MNGVDIKEGFYYSYDKFLIIYNELKVYVINNFIIFE